MTDGGILLRDELVLSREAPVTWVFMLREQPQLLEGEARFGPLCMAFDPALHAAVEEMPVTDARMARNFHGSLWRLTLEAPPAARLTQNFTITRS